MKEELRIIKEIRECWELRPKGNNCLEFTVFFLTHYLCKKKMIKWLKSSFFNNLICLYILDNYYSIIVQRGL